MASILAQFGPMVLGLIIELRNDEAYIRTHGKTAHRQSPPPKGGGLELKGTEPG